LFKSAVVISEVQLFDFDRKMFHTQLKESPTFSK